MSGYGGYSQSNSKNTSNSQADFNQRIWSGQRDALKGLYGMANGLFNQTNGQMQGQMGNVVNGQNGIFNAAANGMNANLQGGAFQGVNGADMANKLNSQMVGMPGQINTQQQNVNLNPSSGTGNQYLDQAKLIQQDTNPYQRSNMQDINAMIMGGDGNNYADAMKAQYMKDANLAQNQMLSNLDARASAAGMPGSSRHGIAEAQGMRDINTNLQRNLAETGFNTFDKDLDRKLQIAQQADANNLARYQSNQQYNTNLINAGNQAAQNAQNYNLGIAGAANQNNLQNLNYNQGMTGSNQNYNLGLQGILGNLVSGNQAARDSALNASQGVSNLGSAGLNSMMMPWQAAQGYAGIVGAPTVLSSGSSNASSMGRSNGMGFESGGSFGGGSSGGGSAASMCYITTAVTKSLGEPDDGPTLTALRRFRDTYMQENDERKDQVKRYYKVAPLIVAQIDEHPMKDRIYQDLHDNFIKPAYDALQEGDNDRAYSLYCSMVNRLVSI